MNSESLTFMYNCSIMNYIFSHRPNINERNKYSPIRLVSGETFAKQFGDPHSIFGKSFILTYIQCTWNHWLNTWYNILHLDIKDILCRVTYKDMVCSNMVCSKTYYVVSHIRIWWVQVSKIEWITRETRSDSRNNPLNIKS